uniref:Putative secreted protein n=1 Tax=Panstrongylus lignarius TaxID=156445 RepID=A0A224XUI3_9HEMI
MRFSLSTKFVYRPLFLVVIVFQMWALNIYKVSIMNPNLFHLPNLALQIYFPLTRSIIPIFKQPNYNSLI